MCSLWRKKLKKKVKIFSFETHCGLEMSCVLVTLLREENKDSIKELNYKSKHKLLFEKQLEDGF